MIEERFTIAIGSDHAGFRYKSLIIEMLQEAGHDVTDMGTHSEDPVDYPLFIRPVAEAVARGVPVLGTAAGAMSEPVLRRLGFVEHGRVRLLLDRL